MDSLFAEYEPKRFEPLAVRLRLLIGSLLRTGKSSGKDSFLRAMIERDTIPSLLFYGPSGTG